jgi:hypothetical protein
MVLQRGKGSESDGLVFAFWQVVPGALTAPTCGKESSCAGSREP